MSYQLCSQKFVEPDKQKQFNITVNYEDYTIKTQMLSVNKDIKINNDRTYLWYGSQKIMETKGGFDGKLIHGKFNVFYLDNQLKEQGIIKYGLRHEEWKYWYPDGKLKEIITWKNGVKNGHYELYNDNGQIMAKGHFKNDKLHGKFYAYGPGGKVTESKVYKNGDEVVSPIKEKNSSPKERMRKKVRENVPEKEKGKEGKKSKSSKKKNKKSDKDQPSVKETKAI
jgi:antitoxin component YwqK of YwqJK toxin-antitoxin module